MNLFESVDFDTLLSGKSGWMGDELIEALVRHPLDCIETEFPHYVRSIDGPETIPQPRERHPVFYGCYDWHSAVHSHWSLVRLLRLYDEFSRKADIVQILENRFRAEKIEQEASYVESHESFEKPYGWAWLCRLSAELHLWEAEAASTWHARLAPLEATIVELVETELLTQSRPFRVPTHQNTAFALQCVLDYARVTSNRSLESAVVETARRMFDEDRNYPVEDEPLGWDFLSPALTEADLMRRVLSPSEFSAWLDGFLPDLTVSPYDSILEPVNTDQTDGVGLHLVGLQLSRAWCFAGIASVLDDHRYREVFERSARQHMEAGLDRAFTDEYAGAHWLTSFVVYLLTRNEGGIAPA